MDLSRQDVRLEPRAQVRIRVVVFGLSPDRPETELTTRDLAAGGMLCISSLPVPLGKPVKVSLHLTDESGLPHPVILEAIALRVEGAGPYAVAFHFTQAPERIRVQVRRFVLRALPPAPPG